MISLSLASYVFSTFLESLQQQWIVWVYLLLVNIDFIGMSSTPTISTGNQITTEDTATSTPVQFSTHPDTSTSTSTLSASILYSTLLNKVSPTSDISMSSTPTISTGNQITTEDTSNSTPVKISTQHESSTSTLSTSILYSTFLNKVSPTSEISMSSTPTGNQFTTEDTATSTPVQFSTHPDTSTSTSTLSASILYDTLLNKVSTTSEITPMNATSSVSITVMNSTRLTSTRVSTSSILSSICKIPSVSGGLAVPTGTTNSTIIISCFSGFNIQGASVLQCVNGSWNFKIPTCFRESHLQTDVHNKIDVNDIGMPTWLLWTLCAVLGLFGLLLLCCMLYICLKMCGCTTESFMGFNQVHPYATRRACCTCCRDGFYHDDGEFFQRHRNRQLQRNTDLTFSLPNEKSARGQSRRIRTLSDSGLSSQQPVSPETDRKLIVKVRRKSRAKSISTWLPHSHPMRNINTSTK
uniref:Uncharacterized protein LOC111109999 n=1 Tax=Crassostrea virginica TaxID=6565 RepID=A0A8B8BGS5_CRAVI|nr:uncharacterized protein LOC111109999 [Crassostrea virginica]